MITCKKCNASLEDGTKFCYICGAAVAEAVQAPESGQKAMPVQEQPAAPVPNPVPFPMPVQGQPAAYMPNPAAMQGQPPMPSPMPYPAGTPVQPGMMNTGKTGKAGKLVPRLLIAAAALAVIVIAAIIIPKVLMKGSNNNIAFYLKDNEINYTSLSSVKPKELTEELVNDYTIGGEDSGSLGYAVAISSDGSKIFYPDSMTSSDEGLTIYYKNLKSRKSAGEKVDSDIYTYQINDSGSKVFYIKGSSRILYINDMKNKEKIDSDVYNFYINADGSKLLYLGSDGDIYLKSGKKDAEKIDSNSSLVNVSDDLSTVYYLKNGSLYLKKAGKDKEKLLSDVSDVINVYDSGEIYYTKSADITYNLSDFVNDDMADTDAAMTVPVEPLYPVYEDCKPSMSYPEMPDYYSYSDAWGNINWDEYNTAYNDYYAKVDEYNAEWDSNYTAALDEYDQAYSDYQAAYDAYYDKQDRDALRQSIAGATIPVTNYALYYYDTKESTEITDTYASSVYYSSVTPEIIYQSNNKADITKVNLSEVYSYDDLYSTASSAALNSAGASAAFKATAAKLPEEGTSFILNDAGDMLYYLDNYDTENSSYDLYEVKISDNKLDIPSKIDNNVYGIEFTYDTNKLMYYKDVKDGVGDLYLNMKLVDSDVHVYSAYESEAADAVVYFVDYDENSQLGTLKLYDGKNSKKVGDDIYTYNIIGKNRILYLVDYDLNSYRGDLYLYNGSNKKKLIDSDVTAILSVYGRGSHGDYWSY